MKIKAIATINLGLYMDIRPEIEIEVPDGLSGKELVAWLHTEYKGLLSDKEKREASLETCVNCGGVGKEPLSKEGLCSSCMSSLRSGLSEMRKESGTPKPKVAKS